MHIIQGFAIHHLLSRSPWLVLNLDYNSVAAFKASQLNAGVQKLLDVVPSLLILLAVLFRQVQARNAVWKKIMNKAADLHFEKQSQGSVIQQQIWQLFRLE
jgi:hypothetical protein